VALSHALHYRPGAAHPAVETARRLDHALPAGSRSERRCVLRCRKMAHSTRLSCRMCWRGWSRPSKPSSVAWRVARRRAFPAFTGGTATTRSPTRRRAPVPGWRTGPWSSPRWGVSPCVGLVRWKVPARPARSAGRRMGGTSPSRVRKCSPSRCRFPTKKPALTWAGRYFW
jgi:hypothetical protein